MYQTIINPKNNERVSINSKFGVRILSKFIKQLGWGTESGCGCTSTDKLGSPAASFLLQYGSGIDKKLYTEIHSITRDKLLPMLKNKGILDKNNSVSVSMLDTHIKNHKQIFKENISMKDYLSKPESLHELIEILENYDSKNPIVNSAFMIINEIFQKKKVSVVPKTSITNFWLSVKDDRNKHPRATEIMLSPDDENPTLGNAIIVFEDKCKRILEAKNMLSTRGEELDKHRLAEINDEIKYLNSLPSETSPNEISEIYYNILNLEKNANKKDVLIAWLTLSIENHPDVCLSLQYNFDRILECNKKFIAVNIAHDRLYYNIEIPKDSLKYKFILDYK